MAKELTKRQQMVKEAWASGAMTCDKCGKLRTVGQSFLICHDCDTFVPLTEFDRRRLRALFPDRAQDVAGRGGPRKPKEGPIPGQMELFDDV